MVESNSNRFRSPSVFKTVQGPALITLHCLYHIKKHFNVNSVIKEFFNMAPEIRIELILKASKAPVLPLHHSGIKHSNF